MYNNNRVTPIIIQPQPQPQKENAACCEQFGKNLKVSSCFLIKGYTNCIDDCDGSSTSYETTTTYRSGRTETSGHSTMSMKECGKLFCLCGIIPLTVQTALLPLTLTWSAADAINKSCQSK